MYTEEKKEETAALDPQVLERLHDPGFLSEYGKIEVLRAIRFKTRFSVMLVEMPPGITGGARNELTKRLASTITLTLRNCDILGMADETHLGAILPDTDHFGALTAARKLNDASIGTSGWDKGPLPTIFAHSTFPRDGNTYDALLKTAVGRVLARKASIWERLGLKERLFWEIIAELLKKGYTGLDNSSFDVGTGQEVPEFFIDHVTAMAVKEIKRAPQRKGVFLVSAKKISPSLPAVKGLAWAGATATKAFIAGERGEGSAEVKGASAIYLDDERLKETSLTFFLTEDSAYALICKEGWGGGFSCFHSSDPFLVEGLLLKFQKEYSQEGII